MVETEENHHPQKGNALTRRGGIINRIRFTCQGKKNPRTPRVTGAAAQRTTQRRKKGVRLSACYDTLPTHPEMDQHGALPPTFAGTKNNTPYALDVKVPLTGGVSMCVLGGWWLEKIGGGGLWFRIPMGGVSQMLLIICAYYYVYRGGTLLPVVWWVALGWGQKGNKPDIPTPKRNKA